MSTIVRIPTRITTDEPCPHCGNPTARTESGIASRRGLAIVHGYCITKCTTCHRAWDHPHHHTTPTPTAELTTD